MTPRNISPLARMSTTSPARGGIVSLVPNGPVNTFRCQDLDLFDLKTHAQLGSRSDRGAGSWGWTSPDGREFVAIAQEDGAAFAEVSPKGKLVNLGRLPQYGSVPTFLWREIKGYKSYVIIGSEALRHEAHRRGPCQPRCLRQYRGLDEKHSDKDICYGYDEDSLTM